MLGDSSESDDGDLGNRRLMATVAGFSFAGSVLVVCLATLFGRLRRSCWRAIVYSAVAEACFTCALLVGDAHWAELGDPASALCDAEAFVLTVSSLLLNAFLLYVAASLLLILAARSQKQSSRGVERLARFATSWRGELAWFGGWLFVGVVFGVLPLTHAGGMSYARVGSGWCHLAPHPAWARFLLYPLQWLIILAIIVCYVAVWVLIRRRFPHQRAKVILPPSDLEMRQRVFSMLWQVVFYPAMLLISWLPTTIARIVGAIVGSDKPWMSSLTAAVVPMMGILIFLCFCATSRVPQELWTWIRFWACPSRFDTPDGAFETPGGDYDASANSSDVFAGYNSGSYVPGEGLRQPLIQQMHQEGDTDGSPPKLPSGTV